MTESEVISRVQAAERELKPLLDFIRDGDIHPDNGVLSYTYAAAQLRANDVTDALTRLLTTSMQHAKERVATDYAISTCEHHEAVQEIERARELINCLIENDPNDYAADAVTVLDVWRKDARDFISATKVG